MTPVIEALQSFTTTRWLSRRSLSRAQFERMQARALQRWIAQDLPRVRAFQDARGPLSGLPVMDKATLMANFADYNVGHLSADAVRDAMTRDFRIGDLTVGASTGTSGNRGLFIISEAERFRWLGTIVAKTIGDLLWRRQRVAILLPQGGSLYKSANRVRQIELRLFDLTSGPEAWREELEHFDPTVIVAPPKVLRHLVEEGFRVSPARVFSAAETLDPVDRPIIEAGFGISLDQIYMATEGLLGATCRHGRLHLAEDSVFFEYEDAGEGLVNPLITSFRRDTQILARYRMNDLLRLSKTPCPCGSPLLAVDEIVGRLDDCFYLQGLSRVVMITPDILRNAVLMADRQISDFRLVQLAQDQVQLLLPPGNHPEPVRAALLSLLKARGVNARVEVLSTPMPLDLSRKLRRVENRHGNTA